MKSTKDTLLITLHLNDTTEPFRHRQLILKLEVADYSSITNLHHGL